jgi:hypothetical protein
MKTPDVYARGIERRKHHRYQLSAPVFFCWTMLDKPLQSGEGMTRDIDTTGAYINACELPPVGALVQMDVLLPNLLEAEPGAHLVGEGKVLRVEQHEGTLPSGRESGFAVSVQFYLETSKSVLTHLKRAEQVM